jgi:nucleotide-binding universal stress UspA family protein
MYKKILVGIDDSGDSKHAIDRAIEYAKRDNSKVVVFHSVLHHLSEVQPSFIYASNSISNVSLSIHEDSIKAGNRILDDAKKLFNQSNLNVETRLIFDISPERYIKDMVKKEDFDLVILGCDGNHSKLKRTILGTIPEDILNNTASDLLIVR